MPTAETYRELFGDKRAPDGSLARDNFASWFGKSAVVDAGRPLVVFHGSVIRWTNWGLLVTPYQKVLLPFLTKKRGSVTESYNAKAGFWFWPVSSCLCLPYSS